MVVFIKRIMSRLSPESVIQNCIIEGASQVSQGSLPALGLSVFCVMSLYYFELKAVQDRLIIIKV